MTKFEILCDYTDRNSQSRYRQSVADWQDLRLAHERPPRRRIFLRAAAYVTGWCALLALAVYALSHADF